MADDDGPDSGRVMTPPEVAAVLRRLVKLSGEMVRIGGRIVGATLLPRSTVKDGTLAARQRLTDAGFWYEADGFHSGKVREARSKVTNAAAADGNP